jgi:ATP-dependent RNA helicase DOB1
VEREADISHYYHLRQQIESLRHQLMSFINTPKNILPFLNPGRLIRVVNNEDDFGWGVVINFRKRPAQNKVFYNLLI